MRVVWSMIAEFSAAVSSATRRSAKEFATLTAFDGVDAVAVMSSAVLEPARCGCTCASSSAALSRSPSCCRADSASVLVFASCTAVATAPGPRRTGRSL